MSSNLRWYRLCPGCGMLLGRGRNGGLAWHRGGSCGFYSFDELPEVLAIRDGATTVARVGPYAALRRNGVAISSPSSKIKTSAKKPQETS